MLTLNQSDRVPLVFQGISQQPAEVRRSGQVEDAWNVLFSAREGCVERYGSWFVASVPGAPANANLRLHPIERDQDEQYLVVYGDGVLRVFQIDGLEATVNVSGDAQAYLDALDADADNLQFVTIGDTTFILNNKKPTGSLASPTYLVDNTYRDYFVMLADSPASGTYHRTREDVTGEAAGYFLYDLSEGGDGTFAEIRFFQNGAGSNSEWWAGSNGYWDDETYGAGLPLRGTIGIGFQRLNMDITGGAWDATNRTLTKAGAFSAYTHRDGDQIFITGGTGHTPMWYSIASKTNGDEIVLVEATTGLSVSNNSNTSTDAIGVLGVVTIERPGLGAEDMLDVALNIQAGLRSSGGEVRNAIVKWTPAGAGGYFTIISPYRGSAATCFPARNLSVAGDYNYTASTAPFSATAGQYVITAGAGSPTEDTLDIEDRWTRQTAPNQPEARPDPTKMPVQMVRTSVGDRRTPAVFDVSTCDWTSRPSGDELSNPIPDFIAEERPIADLTRARGRLMFGAGEDVDTSQAEDLFNLFMDNAAETAESDPIHLSMSGDRVTEVDFLVPFRKTVVVFTKAGQQFEINSPDLFTPTTAAVTASTNYYTLSRVRPAAAGDSIIFPGKKDDVTEIYEYRYYDAQASNLAVSITPHVPRLIPDSLRRIVTSPNDGVIIALPDEGNFSGSELKLYQSTRDEERDARIQSAWTRIGFEDAAISDIAMIGSNCYLLVYDAHRGWAIDVFGVGPAIADASPLDENYIEDVAQCGTAADVEITIDGVSSIFLELVASCSTGATGDVTVTNPSGAVVPAGPGGYFSTIIAVP